MSNQWSSSQFQQGLPSETGQVKMFDPTQFQMQASFGQAHPSKPIQQQNVVQPPQHVPLAHAAHSSWDSWGTWDSHSLQGSDKQQQEAFSGISQSQHVFDNSDSNSGYYTGMWNQGWNGTEQVTQHQQDYNQTDALGHYDQNQHQQSVSNFQLQSGATFDQGSHNDPNDQHHQNQQNELYFNGQFYNQQLEDQGQGYHQDPEGQSHSQVYNQDLQEPSQPYYDQPYGANIWGSNNESEQWTSSQHGFPNKEIPEGVNQLEIPNYETAEGVSQLQFPNPGFEVGARQNELPNPEFVGTSTAHEQQLSDSQSIHAESEPQGSSSSNVFTGPSLECDNDDDGNVSGFHGRDGDGDGDVQLDTQRYIHGNDGAGNSNSSGGNQFLLVTPSFHRTNSEISNASLSTLNLSIGEDDDGQEPLHNIQELVQRMEEVDMARRQGENRNSNTDNLLLEEHTNLIPHCSAGVQDLSADLDHKQRKGDYSGFGSTDHNILPTNLQLEKNIRSASPLRDQPGSAESGESGGSSGLADWEIVSPQTHASTQNSSLENSVSFLADRPDGGVDLHRDFGNIREDKSFQNSQSLTFNAVPDQKVHESSRNLDPLRLMSHHNTSSAIPPVDPEEVHHDSRERSGSPFVAAFTDHRQEETLTQQMQIPSKVSSTTSANSSMSTPNRVAEGGAAGSSKREAVRQAGMHQPNQQVNTSSSMSALPDSRPAAATHQSSDLLRSQSLAAVTSKHKLSTSSSLTEDGNCTTKRASDNSIRTTGSSSTQIVQSEEPPVRSSSRNSEEVAVSSQHQRRPHSAFHAVSRTRQTAMSPATTLWDNSETPTYNILLAPAMPLIIPNLNTSASSVVSTTTSDVAGSLLVEKVGTTAEKLLDRSKTGGQGTTVPDRGSGKTDASIRRQEGRKTEDKNKSYDSLDEVDAVPDDQRSRNYDTKRGNTSHNHDSYRQLDVSSRDLDRPVSRSDRPTSRSDRPISRSERSGHYRYDRPANRTEGYAREDVGNRYQGYYRDYGDNSYDERYDRPRSRQDEPHDSRPSSRSVQEVDRPRSRTNYDHNRDYYYKDRHRGYGYDNYGRQVDYYNDERERYYRYYKEKEARYARGYYDEYYGAKQGEYYYQLQQQRARKESQDSEQSSNRSQSRGSTPATAPSPGIPAPGVRSSSAGPDYYHGSRPSSRADYNRDYYNRGYAYEGYNAFYDGYGYDPYTYGYTYPTYDEYSQGYNQGRMTPPKYSYPHVRASFGPAGQLIKVLPNQPASGQPAVVEMQDVQTVLESCPEADELKHFPGPLTRSHTHKKDVLLFCQQKARACGEDVNMVDRESAQLIWRFLELLIKQNGSVVGTDLADLLLEGHEPSTHEYSLHGVKISQSPEALDSVPEGNSEGSSSTRASPAVRVTSDRTVISSADKERERWIDRFRNLLLYGHKKDALECAMKNNLWGHALFLASKMDARTHANVMTRFANGAIRMNDPIQTLYQLMSGRQPAAVTCIVDDRWGDWRPHLAMILSNQTSRQDIDRKSITTLGDTLAARGCLHASHFCYLMAQVNFGTYQRKTSKIVLVGSNHNLVLEEFATNDAVQCTEVYEYAQSLGNPAFFLPHFQIFKYLYACRLADYGLSSEALQYCEVVAHNIHQYPSWFHATFVKLVYQLSSKLKFSDPQRQMSSEDAEDSVWLQQLDKICMSYDDGSVQPLSGTATPAGFPGTTTSSESGDCSLYGYGYVGDATTTSTTSSAPVVGTYGQHQQQPQADYSGGHDVDVLADGMQNMSIASADQQHVDYSQQQYEYNQWQQQQYGYHYPDYGEPQQRQQEYHEPSVNHQQDTQQQQQHPQDHIPDHTGVMTVTSTGVGHGHVTDSVTYPDHTSRHSVSGGPQLNSSSPHVSSQHHSNNSVNFEAVQHQQLHGSGAGTQEVYDGDADAAEDVVDGPSSSFDYFGNVGTQKVVAPPHRYRHMSGSSTSSTRRPRTMSGSSSTGSVKAAPNKPPPQQKQQQPQRHPDGGRGGDKITKSGPQDNGGSGWFGGLFNKFKIKGKNEMILPDDKNPSIVWDPVKKKWINADGTEEEEASAAPPPKDTDLLSKPPGGSSTSAGPPPPSIAPGGNRFSLKAKGARNQYVDVTNPKAVSIPPNLFNILPGTTTLPAADLNSAVTVPNLFLPTSSHTGDVTVTDANNSNNLDSGLLAVQNSTDKPITDNSGLPATSLAAPSMPILFNPSSLKSGAVGRGPAPSSSAGPGLKVGQRRAYPK